MTTQTERPQGDVAPMQAAPNPIDPNLTIGHVHLRTADIDRVRDFYVGVLGFDVILEARDVPGWGTTGDILFLSAGGYHHHLGFNTWKSAGGPPQPDGVTGPAPRRAALPDARAASPTRCAGCRRSTGRSRQLADHGTHEAIYIDDPDGNDLELCWDRPFERVAARRAGPRSAASGDFDLDDLLAEPAV